MGRSGDQTDIALRVAAVVVIAANRQQARKLALRARIGLQGHSGQPGDFAQPGFQIVEQFRVSSRLAGRPVADEESAVDASDLDVVGVEF